MNGPAPEAIEVAQDVLALSVSDALQAAHGPELGEARSVALRDVLEAIQRAPVDADGGHRWGKEDWLEHLRDTFTR